MTVSPSILLVEDDEDDYVLAREKLQVSFGNDVRLDWVSTWDEGLAAIGEARHDVYLVDFRLGARTGLELVRAASERGCTKPLILLTGEDSPDIDREAMEAGAADYLVKGQITADQLARSIRYGISQKSAEDKLRQNEERFRSVVNHSPTKIHIKDAEGRYILINEEAARLFGVTEEEALGKATHEIFPDTLADEFKKHDQAVLETGKTVVQEERWLRDGDEQIYLTTKFPIEDSLGRIVAVGAIGTDITERKRTERALRESEERFQSFAKIGSDWLWEMDADLVFSYFSDPIHKITGLPREHYLGKSRLEVGQGNIADDDWRRHLADLEGHRPFRDFCYTYVKSDGQQHHWSISGEPIFDTSGEFLGYRGVGTDITERTRTEAALQESKLALHERVADLEMAQRRLEEQGSDLVRLAEDLKVASDEAQAANRAKSEFLAAMSHELRTPLNAIIGFSEIIKNESFGPVGGSRYCDYAKDINDSGQHLLDLINDILDLSKIESGMDELYEEPIDVPNIIDSVLRLVRQRANQRKIAFELDVADRPPLLVADERKLKQILVNLLTNAVKFTDEGGKIGVKVWCHPKSGFVFQISDTGIGIAPENIPKALSQFGQVDSDLSRQYEGTGLGLPLTKALVESHGGCLDLQSEVGVGTTVTVRFPATRIQSSRLDMDAPDLKKRTAV
jgi:two-component system cell cycle sensor histidine kinase PleC